MLSSRMGVGRGGWNSHRVKTRLSWNPGNEEIMARKWAERPQKKKKGILTAINATFYVLSLYDFRKRNRSVHRRFTVQLTILVSIIFPQLLSGLLLWFRNNMAQAFLLSPHRARQLCRIETLHPPRHPVIAAMFRTGIVRIFVRETW
jgi:hypothetical protein